MFHIVAALTIGLCASPASASSFTVRDMLPWCEGYLVDGPKDVMAAYCLGAVTGIHAVMQINCEISRNLPAPRPPLPAADGAGIAEARLQAFVNWARNNPTEWETDFRVGVMKATSETWPCQI